ncbi:MAG: hypothetical protein KF814_14130 [Nitrospiraceae bacterium]|nr:hypothetical protein [Nitrospiraceae bacterium]
MGFRGQGNRTLALTALSAQAVGVALLLCSGMAQAQSSSSPSLPQTPPGQNPPLLGTLPAPANSATITSTASGASAPQVSTLPSSQGKSFGSIGAGLPGMTGGPALNQPLGSQDPASRYMRPPVIPPLFCDPAINIPC